MGRGPGYLLYRILDSMVDYSFPILRRIMANVDDLERRVFETFGQDVVRELALVRRDVLSYRRVVRPQIVVLEELEERNFGVLRVDGDIYFGDLADHMRRIWSELEDLKEVVEGLYDAHGSLAMIRTNDIVRILTVAATVILPFVVVSSVYGMNIDLPFDDSSWSFAAVMVLSGAVSVALLVLFHLRRWLCVRPWPTPQPVGLDEADGRESALRPPAVFSLKTVPFRAILCSSYLACGTPGR